MSGRFVKRKKIKPRTLKTGFLNEMQTSSLRRGFDKEMLKINREESFFEGKTERFLINKKALEDFLRRSRV